MLTYAISTPFLPRFVIPQWEGNMDDVIAEAGEALTVGDPKEAWIFHILPDDTGNEELTDVLCL